jgi:hypothetical protein
MKIAVFLVVAPCSLVEVLVFYGHLIAREDFIEFSHRESHRSYIIM